MANTEHRDYFLERPLPSSPEAERAILGGIILDNGLIAQAVELLQPGDFYTPSHARVYAAMLALFERGAEINPILIGEELRKEGLLEQAGGVSEIANLTYGLPHFTSLEHYAKVVGDKAQLRNLIKAANKITQDALEEEEEVSTIVDRAESLIFAIAERRVTQTFVAIGPALAASAERAEARKQHGAGGLTGITTGINDLDMLTAGWQPSDLIIIAGRPSMGKTALALTMAQNAVASAANPVIAVLSLEMSKESLADRLLSSEARVDSHRYRSAYLNRGDWSRIAQVIGHSEDRRLFIDDTPALTPLEVRAKCRRLAAQQKQLDMVVVDYLQMMKAGGRFDSTNREVQEISRAMKTLAKELKVPVILLSQLSRGPDTRSDHRPILSDLRDSGSIEQDADVVLFVYREEQYHRTEENTGLAELIVAKQRNGPTGTVKVAFLKEFTRFENLWRDGGDSPQRDLLAS